LSLAKFVRRCRSCSSAPLVPFLSLGMTPIANSLVSEAELGQLEAMYPLGLAFCAACTLVQLFYELPADAIFTGDYPYYSSFSDTVVDHARQHARELIRSRALDERSLVVEIGSNDGYMLRNFAEAGIPVLGIDPAPGPAAAARAAGVPTEEAFFDADMAARLRAEGVQADVIIANNVMAHVPDLNSFVAGLATLITEHGVITIENPYVRDLIDHVEFDTVYHEHFCYFSCTAVRNLINRHGLWLNRVEHFPELHGGTLRWTLERRFQPHPSVAGFLEQEHLNGLDSSSYYTDFGIRVSELQKALLDLLYNLNREGKRIAAYGAAAKGATLLNCTRLPRGIIEYVVDRNVHKQGLFMPGVHLPIKDPSLLLTDQPDYVLLLAWNHAEEVMAQLADYRQLGGRFILPIPKPTIVG
jgi:SAM-dependent methyltransferase